MTPQANQPSADVPDDVWVIVEVETKRGGYPPRGETARALARAILADRQAREEARDGGGWRTINSAPKDGVEINASRKDQGVFTCRFAWMEEFVPKDRNGDPTEDYDETVCGWWHDRWGWMHGDEQPTLWMPLPAPPAIELSPVEGDRR